MLQDSHYSTSDTLQELVETWKGLTDDCSFGLGGRVLLECSENECGASASQTYRHGIGGVLRFAGVFGGREGLPRVVNCSAASFCDQFSSSARRFLWANTLCSARCMQRTVMDRVGVEHDVPPVSGIHRT